ncbi:MAG: crossover junction endodeoxyribonuclease RuvC [Candidatus Eisenbacteria bacterium]
MARQACPGASARGYLARKGRDAERPREGDLIHFNINISMPPPIILGLDPGTRFLGAAVIRGSQLLDYGVYELKNGQRPHDVIGQARRVVFQYIAAHEPAIVAIEAPYRIATERGALLTTLARELHERAAELGLEVVEQLPEQVRQTVTGSPVATKYEVAQLLGTKYFPALQSLIPRKPKIPALWLTSKERYWLHAFDALAVALTAWLDIECGSSTTESQVDSDHREVKSGDQEKGSRKEAPEVREGGGADRRDAGRDEDSG